MNEHDESSMKGPPTTGPVLVPLVDEREGEPIYTPAIAHMAGIGAAAGALLLGVIGFTVASGWSPLPHLGQFAAAGTAPAVFTAGGIGFAVGALLGALVAVSRLPRRMMHH